MPNVAEVIRDHVTLAVECVDRLYLNAYVPGFRVDDLTRRGKSPVRHCGGSDSHKGSATRVTVPLSERRHRAQLLVHWLRDASFR